ncbi:MAG: 50S ribosomal protein L23 [Candidatus Omnitrophica bacterium]|jgi:large subunit ribosomal protein L23|nr:50S ribosomal protein L23 [Candidatus Omnitrophota bacterium]MDD3274408.1 50S ribosomal protein L23 [Candidatus Omnitrophota bacterium]MDD5077731.1 50S ribosomal protein L23 [Candidatus Omnitrophota bacterium]MDD5724611.1 50S ribosomal protein L23 [Candidatus Omnitrophota bacterium]
MSHSALTIKALLQTEKSSAYLPEGKYLFLVQNSANKIQIKQAVEQAYKVKVKEVNTFISAGKLKRVRRQLGRTSDTKKAVVTLAEGQKIEIK